MSLSTSALRVAFRARHSGTTLYISFTTTLERCTGCGNIAGINEPTVKDAATGQIVRCQECTRGRVLQ